MLKLCTVWCLQDWLEDRAKREKEMTRAIKIEINSSMAAVIGRGEIEALTRRYGAPPLNDLKLLETEFRNVRLARYYGDLEKIMGEDRFRVWRKELYEVADPWTPDEYLEALQTHVSAAWCRCRGTEWAGPSHTHTVLMDPA